MAREYKKRRKNPRKQIKCRVANMERANDQHENPLGECTNTVHAQSPTKVINRLKKENDSLRTKATKVTGKYWNAQRRTNRLAKAATARKVDLKQAKADATRLRGVVNILGKNLQDLKKTANETTSLLQARIHAFLGEKAV